MIVAMIRDHGFQINGNFSQICHPLSLDKAPSLELREMLYLHKNIKYSVQPVLTNFHPHSINVIPLIEIQMLKLHPIDKDKAEIGPHPVITINQNYGDKAIV